MLVEVPDKYPPEFTLAYETTFSYDVEAVVCTSLFVLLNIFQNILKRTTPGSRDEDTATKAFNELKKVVIIIHNNQLVCEYYHWWGTTVIRCWHTSL